MSSSHRTRFRSGGAGALGAAAVALTAMAAPPAVPDLGQPRVAPVASPTGPTGTQIDAAKAGFVQARAGNTIYRMPEGWVRQPRGDGAVIGPPHAPGQPYFEVRVTGGGEDPANSAERYLAQLIKALGNKRALAGVGQVVTSRGPAGWDSAARSFSTPPVSGTPAEYWTIFAIKAGSRVEAVFYVANDERVWRDNLPRVQAMVDDLNYANLIVLHPGGAGGLPPLTRFDVDREADFLEWLLDVPLTEGQRAALADVAVDAWRRGERGCADGLAELQQASAAFRKLPVEKRDFARQEYLTTVALPAWRRRAADEADCRVVVEAYDAAHRPIAAGDPPLTRQAADALLEVMYFAAGQLEAGGNGGGGNGRGDNGGGGGTAVPVLSPTAEEKQEWAGRLAAAYATLSAEQRTTVAGMPRTWAALRAAWGEMPAGQRSQILDTLGQFGPVQALRTQVAEARRQRQQDVVAAMARMQQQHETFMALMNASYSMHTARMAAISNIGGPHPYTWEYRP